MFLEKSENNADGNEPCFADKIEKDGRTFSVRCVRFSDKSFEISINDTTIVEAQTQLKQQLTQNVAHEFKTPVCSIQGYLETILANYPEKLSEEQLRHFLQRCYSQSSRLNNLVKDMSQLMEINANSQYIEKERVNLSSILRNLLQEINNKLLEQQITVKNNIPEMLLLNGNASMLYSIFRNLFDNAISYAGKGCEIKVDCYRSDSEFYYFSFSDNGEGVPHEHLNRIFERFYRVDKGRSRKLGGTGLGLAIVKNAVLLHDGTISARRSDGGGLEFVFTLRR
jgi:two-component system OmpR family sensor kinase/two-component system phosphate regulon sensor histidine kinase PhoR